MSNYKQKLGRRGEDAAIHRLNELNYQIIKTNWRCKIGELDIVAWHNNCLVFIEVRTRRGSYNGSPEESVNSRKQARLQALVDAFLMTESASLGLNVNQPPLCRIDVVAIEYYSSGQLARLEVIQNAVEG